MFSKSKTDGPETPGAKPAAPASPSAPTPSKPTANAPSSAPAAPKAKPSPSILSSDLQITGHMKTTGDVQVEGTVDGDIHAHLLTIGENAVVKGEVVGDDVVVTGRVVGRVRGLKVRLTSSARVEGDIIHKTIAIESGAHFEGSVQRHDDPLSSSADKGAKPSVAKATAAE